MKRGLFSFLQVVILLCAMGCAAVEPSQFDNLSLGVPGKADVVIDREGFAVGFSNEKKQALWVIYKLKAEELGDFGIKRTNRFQTDPQIPASALPSDYTKSGYDRGHLAPAADMAFSLRTMTESFLMSNMSPQKPQCNRGVWKRLEEQVRDFAAAEKEIYIVTGPIFLPEDTITIGDGQVAVPSYYYKVVYDLTPPRKMIGFILPNDGSKYSLRDFAVTVDAVEKATGLDFFSLVPKAEQDALESTITVKDWHWRETLPQRRTHE